MKEDRRVTVYYFYIADTEFGLGFIKLCAYFPYPGKVRTNRHEWAKRQAEAGGLAFTELANGFASCADPARLQAICDRLGPADLQAFFDRWMPVIPTPLNATDQEAGYWWELSMRQVETSRTLVFDAPRRARGFFEALVADPTPTPLQHIHAFARWGPGDHLLHQDLRTSAEAAPSRRSSPSITRTPPSPAGHR